MKKLQLLTFLSFSLFTFLAAQNSEDQLNSRQEVSKGQHQLGISSNLRGSTTIAHRYTIKNDLLLRSTIRASFGSRFTGFNLRNIGSNLTIGIEKQNSYLSNWSIYYGADVHLRGSLSELGNSSTLGFTGLAGLKFQPTKNLYLFTEFGIGPGFRWSNFEFIGFNETSGVSILGGLQIGILVNIGKRTN